MTMTKPQASTPSLSMSLFGNLEKEAGDRKPSFTFEGCTRVSNLTVPTTVQRDRPSRVPTLGHSIVYPTPLAPEPEVEDDEDDVGTVPDEIEVEIPDDYFDRQRSLKRDEIPEYEVTGENEFFVEPALIDELEIATAQREDVLRGVLFESASLLYAYDDASNFVEAAMRDGLGMEVEMDRESLPEAFVPLARLSVLATFIEQSKLPDQVRRSLLGRLTVRTADEMVLAMNKRKGPEALAALHKHYAATVKQAGVPPDDLPKSNVGVRTSRK